MAPKQILTLKELAEKYKSGELSQDRIMWINDDTASVYVGDVGDGPGEAFCVFRMSPDELVGQALDLLNIPYEVW